MLTADFLLATKKSALVIKKLVLVSANVLFRFSCEPTGSRLHCNEDLTISRGVFCGRAGQFDGRSCLFGAKNGRGGEVLNLHSVAICKLKYGHDGLVGVDCRISYL